MQAVKGYLSDGHFTPTDGTVLPHFVHAVLVLGESITKPQPTKPQEDFWKEFDKLTEEVRIEEQSARKEWLNRLREARQLAANELLPDFPTRTPMGEPHRLTD